MFLATAEPIRAAEVDGNGKLMAPIRFQLAMSRNTISDYQRPMSVMLPNQHIIVEENYAESCHKISPSTAQMKLIILVGEE